MFYSCYTHCISCPYCPDLSFTIVIHTVPAVPTVQTCVLQLLYTLYQLSLLSRLVFYSCYTHCTSWFYCPDLCFTVVIHTVLAVPTVQTCVSQLLYTLYQLSLLSRLVFYNCYTHCTSCPYCPDLSFTVVIHTESAVHTVQTCVLQLLFTLSQRSLLFRLVFYCCYTHCTSCPYCPDLSFTVVIHTVPAVLTVQTCVLQLLYTLSQRSLLSRLVFYSCYTHCTSCPYYPDLCFTVVIHTVPAVPTVQTCVLQLLYTLSQQSLLSRVVS